MYVTFGVSLPAFTLPLPRLHQIPRLLAQDEPSAKSFTPAHLSYLCSRTGEQL
jgi:hypothetical protein